MATDNDSDDDSGLRFIGKLTHKTEPAPLPSTGKSINEFFELKESCSVLLKGAGNNEVTPLDNPPAIVRERWAKEAKRTGSQPPGPDDDIVEVKTAGISFPGLKVSSIAKIGTNLVLPNDDNGSPEWQATLIMDETKPEGLRPIVWIYNKLTGAAKEKTADDQTVHSLSRATAEVSGEEVVFMLEANLEVDLKIPKILLKILPVNKEKAEKQGSEAIQKTLEKDIVPAMTNFREEYIKYLS